MTVPLVSMAELLTAAVARLVAQITLEEAERQANDGAPHWLAGMATRVFTHVPQDQRMRFFRVRLQPASDWGTKNSNGWNGEIEVDSWTDTASELEALEMGDLVMRAFHQRADAPEFDIPSGKVVVLHYASGDSSTEPDHTHHLTQRFNVLAST